MKQSAGIRYNKSLGNVGSELNGNIAAGCTLSVVSPLFSLYAYDDLKKELSKVSKFRLLVPSHGGGEGFLKNLPGNHLSHTGSAEHFAIVGSSSFTTSERRDCIKIYAKLPDWPVLIEVDGKEKLYFIVETKSTLFTEERRSKENANIKCGIAYFESLGKDVQFTVSNSFEKFAGKYV